MEPEPQPVHGGTLARFWESVGSRILFFAGVVVLAVGSVVLLVSLLKEDDPTGPVPAQPTFKQEKPALAKVDPAARKVAGRFILTAVARKNVDDSWEITHPSLRAGFTRREWASGEIPIIPYDVSSIDEARFRVDAIQKNLIQLNVALLPKPGTGDKAGVFTIGLVAVGKGANRHWLVDYWGPTGGPRIPTPPR